MVDFARLSLHKSEAFVSDLVGVGVGVGSTPIFCSIKFKSFSDFFNQDGGIRTSFRNDWQPQTSQTSN